MATSIELENVGRERYQVKDVKAKVQVDRISKELKALEVDDKDFYVCVNRDVDAKFIKDDKSSEDEDKIDQFVVKHHETITVVQGLAKTKLTNPDEWIIKIKRETSETTFFKGKEIIDKISQRQEKLERNKNSPIIQAAIAKETLKRSKEEQKIESNANQEEVNNCFVSETEAPETTPENSPDATKVELDISPTFTTSIEQGVIKVKPIAKKEVKNGTTIVELVKRDVLSEVDPNQSEIMKMATMEADVKKDSTNGVRYVESVKKEVVATRGISIPGRGAPLVATLNNKGAVDTAPVMTDVKKVIDLPASAPPSAPDVKEVIDEPASAPLSAPDAKEVIANAPVITDVKQVIDAPVSAPPSVPDAKEVIDAENDVEVEIHGPSIKPFHGAHVYFLGFETSVFEVMATELARNGGKVCESFQHENCTHVVVDDSKRPNIPSEIREDILVVKVEWFWTSIQMDVRADERLHMYHKDASPNPETWKHATVEAKVENGTTNQPEKITHEKTTLKAKSNLSGAVELPTKIENEKASSSEYGAKLRNQKELASDPNELPKIERESIYAKEDPEAGAEAGKQRVREVFHMDIAELIIER